ncbi:MAG: hypothetical protein ACI4RT_03870 [Candidatus Spyradenecus sp.]
MNKALIENTPGLGRGEAPASVLSPRRQRRRAGMTLLEVTMVSALGVLILGQVISVTLSCQRAVASIIANTELSVALRNLRDKLLFRLTPGEDEGLCSVSIDQVSAGRVTFHKVGSIGSPETLSLSGTSGLTYSEADEDSALARRWLAPAPLVVSPADTTAFRWNTDLDTLYVDLQVASQNGKYTQVQRLAVPRFGKVLK